MNRADFLTLTASAVAAAGLPPQLAQISAGKTFVVPFASAPYPHASRSNGHVYDKKLYDAATHYSNSDVGIFIPNGWQPQDGAIDFVVHFYGWNHDVTKTFNTYRLREQLARSGRNAILVVPQGPTNAPDSGDGKLELDQDGFKRFITDVAAWLKTQNLSSTNRIGRIVLTAHSGGYGGAGGVLARGGMNDAITDVILFDSAYGYYDAFANWVNASPEHHLLSVFTDDTSTGNTALMGMVQGPDPNIYVRLGDTLTPAQLQTRAATFVLTTSIAHDDLLTARDWYAMFLRSTALRAGSA